MQTGLRLTRVLNDLSIIIGELRNVRRTHPTLAGAMRDFAGTLDSIGAAIEQVHDELQNYPEVNERDA